VFLAYVVYLALASEDHAWRIMFYSGIAFPIFQSVAVTTLPESPKWLHSRQRRSDALQALLRVHGGNQDAANRALKELDEFEEQERQEGLCQQQDEDPTHHQHPNQQHSASPQASASAPKQSQSLPLGDCNAVLATASYWRAPMVIIFVLIFFTFFTGGINVRIYAPTIFRMAGMGTRQRAIMTVVLGLVKVCSTGLAVWRIDEMGRRVFFTAGLGLMTISCLLIVLTTAALAGGSIHEHLAQGLVVLGCLGYTMAYQLSFGPGIFVLGSEMFPPRIRGRLLGAQTFFGAICLATTSELFPALVEHMGLAATFSIHLVCCLCCLAFLFFAVVETKGHSPETIRTRLEVVLFSSKPCRGAGHAYGHEAGAGSGTGGSTEGPANAAGSRGQAGGKKDGSILGRQRGPKFEMVERNDSMSTEMV